MKTPAESKGSDRMSFTHPLAEPRGRYQWIYLWHAPLRAMHWIAALCVVVLIATGFYIGRPYFMVGEVQTATPFVMGWVRFVHFVAAGALVATGIVRIYWLFVGNRFERWPALFPVRKRDWINLGRRIKYYLLIHPERGLHYLGHNPLQQIMYTTLYVVTIAMVLTGFAMYGQSDPDGFFAAVFGWVAPLLGGIQVVRFVHHLLTWFYIIYIPIHIYFAMRAEVLEHTGTISSMVSGGRWLPTDAVYVDAPPGSAFTRPRSFADSSDE